MGIDSLSRAVALSGLTIAVSSLPGVANGFDGRFLDRGSNPGLMKIAQVNETNCRQTNAVAGIYQQPDPVSVSQGVLPAGQTVRLEVVGTGTGWSRIREPIVGWVEARYLTPPTPCAYPASAQTNRSTPISAAPISAAPITPASSNTAPSNTAPVNSTTVTQASNSAPAPQVNPEQPVRSPINATAPSSFPQPTLPSGQPQVTVPPLASPQTASPPQGFPQPVPQQNTLQKPQPNNVVVRPTVQPLPAIVNPRTAPSGRAIVTTTCDVLPREGLIVRRQPDLTSPGTALIPVGTYNFQFTGATQTVGRQRLAYIVAPAEGWIPVGTLDGVSNLGGGRCG